MSVRFTPGAPSFVSSMAERILGKDEASVRFTHLAPVFAESGSSGLRRAPVTGKGRVRFPLAPPSLRKYMNIMQMLVDISRRSASQKKETKSPFEIMAESQKQKETSIPSPVHVGNFSFNKAPYSIVRKHRGGLLNTTL